MTNIDEYYAENYTTSFENKKALSIWRFFLEYLLFATIALDIFGVLTKEWIIALRGGSLMIFYFGVQS